MFNILISHGNANKMTLGFHLTYGKMTKFKNTLTVHTREGVKKREYSSIAFGGANFYNNFVKSKIFDTWV